MKLAVSLGIPLLAGAALGLAYFLALRVTVQRLHQQRHPGMWMALGLIARLALALAVFVLAVREGGWPALAAALAGFLLARTVLVRRVRAAALEPEGPP